VEVTSSAGGKSYLLTNSDPSSGSNIVNQGPARLQRPGTIDDGMEIAFRCREHRHEPERKKRLPCRNRDFRNLRTTNDTVMRRLFSRTRRRLPIGAHDILSPLVLAVSPYWYIRGVTPRCRIRRCEPRERQAFLQGLPLGDKGVLATRARLRRVLHHATVFGWHALSTTRMAWGQSATRTPFEDSGRATQPENDAVTIH
jgi:hypothetical protein